ncbi:MAG: hypothetical protein Cons2KO_26340 [Congregibacter sp.]
MKPYESRLRRRFAPERTDPRQLGASGGSESHVQPMILVGSSATVMLAFAAYWSMPVFAAGGVFLLFISILLAFSYAAMGAKRSAIVAFYYILAACLPFVVPRDGAFFFQQGYIMLAPGGLILAVVLFLFGRRRAVTT